MTLLPKLQAGTESAPYACQADEFPNGMRTDTPTVVEMVSGFGSRSFGLGYAALHLAAAVHRAGADVYLASLDETEDALQACEAAGFPKDRLILGAPFGCKQFRVAPLLLPRLAKIPRRHNAIVHLHGMWTHASYLAARLKRRWNCPLVLSPHGELEPYALGISPRIKAAAAALYARENVMTASCLWTLSEQEKASVRGFGFQGRVEVIPNGIGSGLDCDADEVAAFRIKHSIAPASRVALYLSRIAKKKNLPLLLRAFAQNLRSQPCWTLVVAGPDERGHSREIRDLAHRLGIERSVRMIGRVIGREKACAFTTASLFALPSHSEGLPIAVLEAMEYGKPLLVTDGWALPTNTSSRCGWRVPAEDAAFTAALFEAMNSSEQDLAELGRAGRDIVRKHFGWDSIGAQACSLYVSLIQNWHRGGVQ